MACSYTTARPSTTLVPDQVLHYCKSRYYTDAIAIDYDTSTNCTVATVAETVLRVQVLKFCKSSYLTSAMYTLQTRCDFLPHHYE